MTEETDWDKLYRRLINSEYHHFHTDLGVLLHGDCLEVLEMLPNESVNLVITDPPYGISFQSNFRKEKFDRIKNDDNLVWVPSFISELYRVLKNNSCFYCFTRWDVYPYWFSVIKDYFTIKNLLIIKRKHEGLGDLKYSFAHAYESVIFAMKGKRAYNKLRILPLKRIDGHAKNKTAIRYRLPDLITFMDANEFNLNMRHPTQKSRDLIKLFVEYHSNEEEIVLDPFLGSGVTAVACEELNRRWIGIEIVKHYCDIAQEMILGRDKYQKSLEEF